MTSFLLNEYSNSNEKLMIFSISSSLWECESNLNLIPSFGMTKYTGSDPEVDTGTKVNPLAIGVDYSAYPKSRAFNFGLNLSF